MAATPKLSLPVSPRTSVFRALVRVLRSDEILRRTIRPEHLLTWEGQSRDKEPLARGNSPALRLTPMPGAATWWSPDAMIGPLTVAVEAVTPGLCVDDVLNLWTVIERAIYPTDLAARNTIQGALRAAGAETGLVEFTQPAMVADADSEEGCFTAAGQMRVMVLLEFNP
jgi:hypothetical protein